MKNTHFRVFTFFQFQSTLPSTHDKAKPAGRQRRKVTGPEKWKAEPPKVTAKESHGEVRLFCLALPVNMKKHGRFEKKPACFLR
jgi:hypothetical protein